MERTDDAGREVLEAMEAEHGEIDPILRSCGAGFAKLAAAGDEDTRNALVVRLCAGKESLGRHLAHEETDAIAIIQQVMSDDDWTAAGSRALHTEDDAVVAAECDPVAPPGAATGGTGEGVRRRRPCAAGHLVADPGGFARRERRAFRYLA